MIGNFFTTMSDFHVDLHHVVFQALQVVMILGLWDEAAMRAHKVALSIPLGKALQERPCRLQLLGRRFILLPLLRLLLGL